jgi:hypothetical protein
LAVFRRTKGGFKDFYFPFDLFRHFPEQRFKLDHKPAGMFPLIANRAPSNRPFA